MSIKTTGIWAVLAAAVVAVLGCCVLGLGRAGAQEQQYAGEDGSDAPRALSEKVTLCHYTGSAGNPYVTITVDRNSTAYQGHRGHPNDIIPAPAEGCPSGPPEPTTPEPTATTSATATATASPGGSPEPTTPESTTPETTNGGVCPDMVPPTASPTVTATAAASPPSSPTASAVDPGEEPGGEAEVTGPEGGASTIALYDLDVGDPSPHPGGPGGITRSEALGQEAAAQALLEGGDSRQAVVAAEPFLNACDSLDAARLAAAQLEEPLPDTGGPASLAIFAAALLLVSGGFAWRLGMGGRR